MLNFVDTVFRQVGIRQRSLGRRCRMGRATELVFILATGAVLSLGGPAQAQTWDGGGADAFWGTANNWNPNGVPANGGVVIVNGAGGGNANPNVNAATNNVTSTAISGGTVTVGSILNSGTVTVSGTGTLTISAGGEVRGSSTPTNTALTVSGGTLNNNGTVTGALTVSSGTANNAGVVTGATTISGGILNLNAGTNLGDAQALTVNGGTVNVNADDTVGELSGTGGTLAIANGAQLRVTQTTNGTFSGAMTGAQGLNASYFEKLGTGTLTLSGTSSVTGAGRFEITSGTVQVSGGNAIGDQNIVGIGIATLELLSDETVGGLTSLAGSTVNLNANTLTFAGLGAPTGLIADTDITGSGNLVYNAADLTTTFNGAMSYTGDTTVAAGFFQLGANNIISDASDVIINGGTLAMQAFDDTVASISLQSGSITGTGTLTSNADFDVRAGSASAVLAGSVGLNKTTGGAVTLTGANTYTGTTAISAGSLSVTGAGSIASTTVNVTGTGTLNTDSDALAAGATVSVGTGATYTSSGTDSFTALTQTGGTVNGSGVLTLSGAFQQSGGTTGGSVDINAASFTQSGGATIAAGTTVTSSGPQSLQGGTIAGTLDGAGAVTVSTGTTSLTGAGAITAATSVGINAGGTLTSDGDGINDTAAVTNAGTLTITGNETIGSLQGGGTVNLTGANLTTGNASINTFSGTMQGTGGLVVQGTSVTALAGTNTFSGGTTINSGTLSLANSGSNLSDTGLVTVNAPGTLELVGDETIGAVQGSGTVDIFSGVLTTGDATDTTLSGNITTTGGTGTLVKQGSGTFTVSGNVATDVTVNAGTLALSGTNTMDDITVNGTGRLRLLSNNAAGGAAGQITTTGSVISYGNGVNSATPITLNSNTTQLEVLAADSAEQSGAIDETGGARPIEKIGTGTLVLSGTNTYTGTTTVTAGTLDLQNGAAISDTSGVTVASSGTLTVTDAETIGALVVNGGTVNVDAQLNSGSLAGAGGSVVLDAAAGLVTGVNNTSTSFGGVISGGGFVQKVGTGTQTLTGANTYTGGTTVSGGVLAVTGAGSLDTAFITIDPTGSVTTDGGAFDTTLTITNNGLPSATSAPFGLSLTGGGDESIASLNGTGTTNLSSGSVLTLNSGTSTIGGVVSGAGGLTVAGGTTNLNAANTYTGATTVSAGTLNLNNGAAIADAGAVVVNGGTVEVNANETIGSLAGTGGTVDLNANTLTTGGNNTATTYDGVITGSGALTKAGSGNFTITGTNTYTGITTVSDGTLTLQDGAAIVDAGVVELAGDGILAVDDAETIGSLAGVAGTGLTLNAGLTTGGNGASTTMAGNISGAGTLTKTGAGTFVLSGTNSNTGDIEVTGGILALSGGAAVADLTEVVTTSPGTVRVDTAEEIGSLNGSGAVVLNATLTTGGNGLATAVSGVISGGGSLIMSGPGLMELSGANTYTGTTTVQNGSELDVSGSIVSNATVNAGGVLANTGSVANVTNAGTYTATAATTGALTNTGTSTVTGGTTASVTNNAGTTDLVGATITGSVTNTAGTVTSTGITSALSVINSGTFEAEGTLDADVTNNAGGTFSTTAALNGGGETFTNDGTLNVINGGYTSLASLTNNEVVNVTGQTLSATSVTNNDRIILTSGTIGGAFTNAPDPVAGDPYTGGQIQFNGASILSTGSISGGRLDGTSAGADLDTADSFTLSAGTTLSGVTSILNVNSTAQDADQIIATGATISGGQYIFRELGGVALGNRSTVVVGSNNVTGFTVQNANGTATAFGGAVVYSLVADGADLALVQETSAGIGGIAAGVSLTQSLIGNVVNRPTSPFASGLAAEEGCSRGGFARGTLGKASIEGSSTNSVSTRTSTVNADYYGVQGGYDFGCNDGRFFGGGWDAAFGALVGYNSGSTDQPVLVNTGLGVDSVASTTLTDFDQTYVGLYAVASRERLTADVQLRFDNTKFQLSERVNPDFLGLGLSNEPEFDTDTVTFTARLSYQIPLNDKGLAFVPTGGFAYSRTSDASVTFDNGDVLALDSFTSTVGFVGGTIAKQSVSEDGLSGQAFFGSVNYYNDFGDDRTSTFTSGGATEQISSSNIGGFGELSVGWNYVRILENGPAGAKQLNANVRADARFGGSVSDSYSLTAQVRLSF